MHLWKVARALLTMQMGVCCQTPIPGELIVTVAPVGCRKTVHTDRQHFGASGCPSTWNAYSENDGRFPTARSGRHSEQQRNKSTKVFGRREYALTNLKKAEGMFRDRRMYYWLAKAQEALARL